MTLSSSPSCLRSIIPALNALTEARRAELSGRSICDSRSVFRAFPFDHVFCFVFDGLGALDEAFIGIIRFGEEESFVDGS